jgi:hypothetical protein
MAKKSDIPFSSDPSRLFLPWISMLMIFVAILTLAGGLTAYKALSYWNKNVSGSITVQIPVVDDKGKPRGEEIQNDIEKALTILRTNPGILGAKVLENDQMRRLMTPWLGNHTDINALPLPQVIDVSVDTVNPPKIEDLNDAYHIGASYFLKLKNYAGDFESLWNYHIRGILQEYLRGNPNAQEELTKLKAAYDREEMKAGE